MSYIDEFDYEYIDFWSEVFTACRLSERGVRFKDFLVTPWNILAEHGQAGAPASMVRGYFPLLPKQADIARRIAAAESEASSSTTPP